MNTLSIRTQFPQTKMLSPVRNKLEKIIFESLQQRLLNEVTDYNDVWPANTPTGWENKAAENFLKSVGAFAKNIGSNAGGLDKVYGPFYEVYYNASYNPSSIINTTALDLKNPAQKLTNKIQFYKETLRFYKNGEVKFVSGGIDPLTGKQRNSPRLAGWSFSNNEIQIYEKADDHSNLMGKFKKIGNKLSFVMDASQAKKAKNTVKGDDDWSVKDAIQLALDVVGWVPFYGEIADLANCAIYLYDYTQSGNNWDIILAALSLIGAVPLVGSVISSGGKGIVASMKAYKKVTQSTDIISQILGKLFKNMNPSANEIELILKGYHGVVTNFTKLKVVLHEQLGQPAFDRALTEMEKELKRGEDFIQSAKRNADVKKGKGPSIKPKDPTDAAIDASGKARYNPKTGKFEVPNKSAKRASQYSYGRQFIESLSSLTYERKATKIVDAVNKMSDTATNVAATAVPDASKLSKVTSFLKQCLFYSISPKNQKFVISKLTNIFQRAVLDDPDRLLVLIRSSKKNNLDALYTLLKTTDDYGINSPTFAAVWDKHMELLRASKDKKLIQFKKDPTILAREKQAYFDSNQYKPIPDSNDGLSQILTTLRESPETVDEFGIMAQELAQKAILTNNPIWNQLLSSPWTTLKAYSTVDRSDFTQSILKPGISNLINLLAKQIAHEGKEIWFKMGATNEGDARGVLSKYFAESWKEHSTFLQSLAKDALELAPVTTSDKPLVVPQMPKAAAIDNTVVRPASRPRTRSINSFGAEK